MANRKRTHRTPPSSSGLGRTAPAPRPGGATPLPDLEPFVPARREGEAAAELSVAELAMRSAAVHFPEAVGTVIALAIARSHDDDD